MPYFAPITTLKGVGPAVAQAAATVFQPPLSDTILATPLLRDVLFHVPARYEDRRTISSIRDAKVGSIVTLKVTVVEVILPAVRFSKRGRPLPTRVVVEDASGSMQLVYYHARGDYLTKLFTVGAVRLISGRYELHDGIGSMAHPDYVLPESRAAELLRIQPVYPASQKFGNRQVGRLMQQALHAMKPLAEWQSDVVLKRMGWGSFTECLFTLHAPHEFVDEPIFQPSYARLVFDEFFAHQIVMKLNKKREITHSDIRIDWRDTLLKKLLAQLSFELTSNQKQVLADVQRDLQTGQRMVRLVQGDVGSGKTILALAAMLQAAASGYQALLMAPTDVLARQHVQSLGPLAEAMGFSMDYLSGKMPKREQSRIKARIASGEAMLVVGTHALFQEDVVFKNLGLVVIDEQQRFGVAQRLALVQKRMISSPSAHGATSRIGDHSSPSAHGATSRIGDHSSPSAHGATSRIECAPHMLQLSATPIPRSLMMAYYGDMECSVLSERPPGRKPVETRAIPLSRQDEVIEGMARAIARGEKIFWVCPLIAPSEEDVAEKEMHETAAAEDRYALLQKYFPEKVGLVHGQMKVDARNAVMQEFAFGALQVLVATTVIEVGVNVPEATIMVIESAERFGLSQLHQLRGRVGRGDKSAHCILLYRAPLGENSKARLSLLRETQDGFVIAEEDLRLRGAGDVLGTKQTGLPEFYFADIIQHADMLRMARDEAENLLRDDPHLTSPRGQHCRILLRLFGYDAAMELLKGV